MKENGRKFTPTLPTTRSSSRLNKNIAENESENSIIVPIRAPLPPPLKRNVKRETDSNAPVSGPFSQGPSASSKKGGAQRILPPSRSNGSSATKISLTQEDTGLNRAMKDIIIDEIESSHTPRTAEEPLTLKKIANSFNNNKEINLSDLLLIQLPQFPPNISDDSNNLGVLRCHRSGKYSIKFPNNLIYNVIDSSFGDGSLGGDRMKVLLSDIKNGTINDLGQITKHLACTPSNMQQLVECLLRE